MRILIILLMLSPISLIAQLQDTIQIDFNKITVDNITGKITYTFIDSIPGANKNLLYGKCLEWIAKNFNNATEVIKLQDKENGKIIAKGFSELSYVYQRVYGVNYYRYYQQHFTLDLTLRDQKYRLVLTDFVIKTIDPVSETNLEWYLPQIQGYDYSQLSKLKKINLFNFKNIVSNSLNSSDIFNSSINKMMQSVTTIEKW